MWAALPTVCQKGSSLDASLSKVTVVSCDATRIIFIQSLLCQSILTQVTAHLRGAISRCEI